MISSSARPVSFAGALAVIVREMGNGVLRVEKATVLELGAEAPPGFEPIDLPVHVLLADCVNSTLSALGFTADVISRGLARPICHLSFELMVWFSNL